jgi:hypothetical protein
LATSHRNEQTLRDNEIQKLSDRIRSTSDEDADVLAVIVDTQQWLSNWKESDAGDNNPVSNFHDPQLHHHLLF